MIPVNNPHYFKERWNNMDDTTKVIDAVQIILHGTITDDDTCTGFLYFEDESKNPDIEYRIAANSNAVRGEDDSPDINIHNLKHKKINELYFSSCNSANPDAEENTASAFEDVVDANEITGWDGGTVYKYNDEEPEKSEEVAGGEGGYSAAKMKFTDGCGWHLVPTETSGQPTWWRCVKKDEFGNPVRERQGKVRIK